MMVLKALITPSARGSLLFSVSVSATGGGGGGRGRERERELKTCSCSDFISVLYILWVECEADV